MPVGDETSPTRRVVDATILTEEHALFLSEVLNLPVEKVGNLMSKLEDHDLRLESESPDL